jgi:disease resistance protein RPM1
MDFATALLPKLAQLLQDEYNLHKGARKGVQFLSGELEAMHAALRRIGEVPREELDELHRIWARDVKELSYDMEDIVDTFMVEIQSSPDPPSKRSAKKIFNKMVRKVTKAMARREVAQEINDIRQRIRELAERRDRLIS